MAQVKYVSIYVKKVNVKTSKKIDSIAKKTSLPKWHIINVLLGKSLGLDDTDVSNWTK